MPKITEILFDCDNTLVLSEELAFEACADIANEILEKNNIDHRYTGDQLIVDFVGQNFRGMMVSLQAKFNFTLTPEELEAYVKEEENRVIAKLVAKAKPCVGANEELEKLAKSGKNIDQQSPRKGVLEYAAPPIHSKYANEAWDAVGSSME
ncbi:hypothetical protein CISG_10102 [Coccidioides immitis RMSCC 3703]|uniref:Uncharacterized protein n=1 Tax=Coccidioides immitis RMSCC 3703 TaxID=454286 RepID=A0A0J8QME2_COCIT|nr:hypothetical protein CISG_10102 [Coccidioides immitis RMSCC 3703]